MRRHGVLRRQVKTPPRQQAVAASIDACTSRFRRGLAGGIAAADVAFLPVLLLPVALLPASLELLGVEAVRLRAPAQPDAVVRPRLLVDRGRIVLQRLGECRNGVHAQRARRGGAVHHAEGVVGGEDALHRSRHGLRAEPEVVERERRLRILGELLLGEAQQRLVGRRLRCIAR